MRTHDDSHMFETGGNENMTVEQLEFKCGCLYDVEQQISAGILTASGSLGASTQNEVSQGFDVCIVVLQKSTRDAADMLIEVVRPNFNYYRELQHNYLAASGTSEAQAVSESLVLRTCAEDPAQYGNGLPSALNIAGDEYVLAVIQDERSMPPNTSFLTDARIYPSNHRNSGDNAGIDFAIANVSPNTGLMQGNCAHRAGFPTVGTSFTDGVPVSDNEPDIPRSMLTADKSVQNKSFAIMAFELPSSAWLGYSFNLYYVRTTRCSTINDSNCRTCGVPARRRLQEAAGASSSGNVTTVALSFSQPKHVLSEAGVTTRDQAVHNFMYDSTCGLAALLAMITALAA